MKKALPILFVASTVVVTAASLTVATNGGFTQLRAADNSVEYTLTFTKNNITSSSVVDAFLDIGTLSFSTTTTSGATFTVSNATVKGDKVLFNKTNSSNMVDVDCFAGDDYSEASIDMSFNFNGITSAVSVTLNGLFEYFDEVWETKERENTLVFYGSDAVDGSATINVTKSQLNNFYISSIVVQYTCSY